MTTAPAIRRSQPSLAGTIGGTVGGLAFGLVMYAVGMFPTVARLVNDDSFTTGLLVHLGISLLFGALYGLLLAWRAGSWRAAVSLGLVYGVFWWVLGANILMPLLLGVPVTPGGFISTMSAISLGGHLLYGVITGLITHGMTSLTD